ncbi:hypothetical protein HDU81_003478 [Chytriomyces hyalinus]|nr:hypothetical protein HDU81_003478 [Chytriomyces hyalinus]
MTLVAVAWALVIAQAVVARNISVQYFGGPLVERAQVSALFYGTHPYQERLLDFLDFLPQSPLMDLVAADYSTVEYPLVHGALSNHTTHPIDKLELDDELDVKPLLRSLLQKRTISYSSNAVFLIFLSPGVSFTHGKSHSCLDICAYHNSLETSLDTENTTSQRLYYAVIPSCNTGSNRESLYP